MDPTRRKLITEAVAEVRARVSASFDERPAPVYSQGWVDKRRLLLVEQALELIDLTVEGDALDVRRFAEAFERLLHQAKELAPGHGMETAAEAVLSALEKGDPTAEPHH